MKIIILILFLTATTFGQSPLWENMLLFDDQTSVFAIDLDGATEYASKTTPVNLDLNGDERIADSIDIDMEVGTSLITNGTFGSNITGWDGGASTIKWYNTDWNGTVGARVNVLLDSATATANCNIRQDFSVANATRYLLTYKYYIPSSNTTTNGLSLIHI